MSKEIDERVVQMQFDNRQFESNVKTSLSTLDKLKQALNFSGAEKGLDKVSDSAKKINLNPLSSALDTVKVKFSALEIAGITALSNLTTSALRAGERIISAFTIDPILSGFREYETQINAVQTILANTSSKGTTLEQVNEALDELNTYADKTIYNFTEMTRNIGTFTAAGIELETSVSAIQGIANLAAVSGSNAQQASTAMYQLSQALAAGTVKLQDWNSVVNAGMGGEVFQNALKETARLHGIAVDQMIEKNGSFRESLKDGWITAEVLTETLSKFTTTGANEYIAENSNVTAEAVAQMREQALASYDVDAAYREMAKSLAENSKLTEDQIYDLLNMSTTAEDAATKVKTFTQLMDTLKEAAQSGWTQTWEILIGDFEEAKELFTELSDTFGAIINESAEARNSLLESAMASPWDQLESKITDIGISASTFQDTLIEVGKTNGVVTDQMIEDAGGFEESLKSGWLTVDVFTEAINKLIGNVGGLGEATGEVEKTLESLGDVVDRVIIGEFGNGEDRVKALTEAGYDYATVQNLVNKTLAGQEITVEDLSDAQLENLGLTEEQIDALKDLAKQAEETGTPLNALINKMYKPSGRELLIDSLRNAILKGLIPALQTVHDAWEKTFPPMTGDQLYEIVDKIHDLSENLVLTDETADKLSRTFQGLFSVLKLIKTFTGGALSTAFRIVSTLMGATNIDILDLTANVGDAIVAFDKWVESHNYLTKASEGVVTAVEVGSSLLEKWIKSFDGLPEIDGALGNLTKAVKTTYENISNYFSESGNIVSDFITDLKNLDDVSLDSILAVIKKFKDRILDHLSKAGEQFIDLISAVNNFKDTVVKRFEEAGDSFDDLRKKIINFVDTIADKFRDNIGIGEFLTIGLGASLVAFGLLIAKVVKSIKSPIDQLSDLISGLSGVLGAFQKTLKAEAIKTIAESIAILAGSVIALTLIDQDKAWSAMQMLLLLAGAITALSFAVSKMDKGLESVSKLLSSFSLLQLAGSVVLIALALKQLEGVGTEGLLKSVGLLGAIIAALVGVSKLMSTKDQQYMAKGSIFLISFAASVKVLVGAIEDLDEMNIENAGQVVISLAGMVGGLALVSKAAKGLKIGSAASIIAIAASLKLLIGSFEDIAELDTKKMADNIDAFVAIFGTFAGLMVASHFSGANASKLGISILAMSVALKVIISAFKSMSTLDPAVIKNCTDTITQIMVVFGALTALSKLSGANSTKAGLMIMEMSAALLVISGVMVILSKLDPDGLDQALDAITQLQLVFGAVVALSGLAGNAKGTMTVITVSVGLLGVMLGALSMIEPENLQSATLAITSVISALSLLAASTSIVKPAGKALTEMTVVVAALAGILALMSALNVEASLNNALSISVLLTAMSGSLALMNGMRGLTKNGQKTLAELTAVVAALATVLGIMSALNVEASMTSALSISTLLLAMSSSLTIMNGMRGLTKNGQATLIMLTAVVAGIAAILGVMAALDVEPSIETAASISLLLVTMTATTAALSAIGMVSAGVTAGLVALGEVVAGVGLVMTALGALVTYIPEVEDFLDNGLPVLEKIGYGIGSFVGHVVGGFSAGAVSGLPEIAETLSDFMTRLQPFISDANGIDESIGDSVSNLASALMTITGANIISAIGSLLGAGDITEFANKIVPFGAALKDFSNEIEGFNPDTVTAAANAGKTLAEMAATIPANGGLLSDFFGTHDIKAFGDGLNGLGEAIMDFYKAVSGGEGGNSLDATVVTAAANAGKAIAELAATIPNTGGLLASFLGENDMTTFGSQLGTFGRAMTEFSNEVSGMDINAAEKAANIGNMLTALADSIPNSGGIISIFTGDNDIESFGNNLKAFGRSLAGFSSEVQSIDSAKISAVIAEVNDLVAMAKGMEGVNTGQITAFSSALTSLANTNITGFITAFSNAKGRMTSAAISALDSFVAGITVKSNDIIKAFNTILTLALNKVDTYKSKFKTSGKDNATEYKKGIDDTRKDIVESWFEIAEASIDVVNSRDITDKFYDAGMNVVLGFKRGLDDYADEAEAAARKMASAAADAAREELQVHSPSELFYFIASMCVEGFSKGFYENTSDAEDAGKSLAEAATEGMSLLQDKIDAIVGTVTSDLVGALGHGSDGISGLTGQFVIGSDAAEDFWEKYKTLSDDMEEGSETVEGATETIDALSTSLDKVGEVAEQSASKVAVATSAVGDTMNVMDFASDVVTEFERRYASAFTALGSTAPMEASRAAVANLANTTYEASKAAEQAAELAEQSNEKATKAAEETLTKFEELKQSFQELRDSIFDTVSGQMDIFSEFSTDSDLTSDQLLANMESQIAGFTTWADNIQLLAERGINQGLLQTLAEMGPQGYEYVSAFVSMTEEQLSRAGDLYAQSLIIPETVTTQILSSYAYAGLMASQGFTNAIDPNAASANVTELGSNALNALQTVLQEHSPSRATYVMGENFIAGFVNGVNASSSSGAVAAQIATFGSSVLAAFQAAMSQDKFNALAATVCLYFVNGFNNNSSIIQNGLDTLLSRVVTTSTTNVQSSFTTAGSTLITYLNTGINNQKPVAEATFRVVLFSLLGEISSKYTNFQSNAQTVMTFFINGITSKKNESSQAVKSVLDKLLDDIKGRYSEFETAGRYLVEGFAAGITANTYLAEARARAMAAAAAEAAANELDEHSPSRVGYQIGDYFGLGFVNAISGYASKAYESSAAMADMASKGLNDSIRKIKNFVLNGFDDLKPTITPVLDLSEVSQRMQDLDAVVSRNAAMAINADMARVRPGFFGGSSYDDYDDGNTKPKGNTYNFTQNNYSPKALSRGDIYRQTKNQFSAMERMVES